jgi:hypothetical protein
MEPMPTTIKKSVLLYLNSGGVKEKLKAVGDTMMYVHFVIKCRD